MGTSITVTQDTFTDAVLQASNQGPVLVDFYATWCGPCQMLKPILDKLVTEYNFTLAKVDIDENPELAKQYKVGGVPDVRVVVGGQVQPGFVGALPEEEIRELLHRLQLTSELDVALEKIYGMASAGDLDQATTAIEALVAQHPNNAGVVLEAANFFIEADQVEKAETLLGRIPQTQKELAARARGLLGLIQFKQAVRSEVLSELDGIYRDAAQAALDQNYEPALQDFLKLVERDRQYRQDAGRRAMLALFDLLGNEHELTIQYRKSLVMALY
jgi:putative thioredoxin